MIAADLHLKTESYPNLRIKYVGKPEKRSQPLQITLELGSKGKTAVAVSQEQFTIHIDSDEPSFHFVGNASFPTNAPRICTVMPNKPITLSLSSSNRLGEIWSGLTPGTYTLVYINSGKSREFDYQWLGQTYSDDYKLVIKWSCVNCGLQ